MSIEAGKRKERVGVVVSDAAQKTIVVRVVRRAPHPRYGKLVKYSKKYHAHDEQNEARVGDRVRIVECRPCSRLKRWRLVEVLERPGLVEEIIEPQLEGAEPATA
jgi:small subunit ribosomal protein S17